MGILRRCTCGGPGGRLAACRAVLFSSLVNDPDDDPMYGIDEDTARHGTGEAVRPDRRTGEVGEQQQSRVINAAERWRSPAALQPTRWQMASSRTMRTKLGCQCACTYRKNKPNTCPIRRRSTRRMTCGSPEQVNHFLAHYAPPVLDPFAGGGRSRWRPSGWGWGLRQRLNPVAVLINKAMIEIPPKFAGMPPVNPGEPKQGKLNRRRTGSGAQGLAEDVRYYGKWMRDEAEKRIGHLYPKVEVTAEMAADRPDLEPYVGKELTVIAWLWARTVKSPNPAILLVVKTQGQGSLY
jgi:putative DNA methylase